MTELPALLDDLAEESSVVDGLLDGLTDDDWSLSTPAAGWSVRDQVSHLAYFDDTAVAAATDSPRFLVLRKRLLALGETFPDVVAAAQRHRPPGELLAWYRSSREYLLRTMAKLEPKQRMPWFGPDMSVLSCATARLMETWAHGLDLFQTFGRDRVETDRIRHVAHLGVRTMGFSFALRGRSAPAAPVRVELAAPSGAQWTWGNVDAADRVTGDALDFCLVVTQRRDVADTGLAIEGQTARAWMSIAQAFAGAPGPGRPVQHEQVQHEQVQHEQVQHEQVQHEQVQHEQVQHGRGDRR